ncbi:amidohydrolase family protein [Caldiplasma sukawensis]
MNEEILIEDHFFIDSRGKLGYGDIIISRGKIAKITDKEPPNVINSDIVIPGFANTHTHVAMGRFRGLLDDLSLEKFLDKTFSLDNNRRKDDIYSSSTISICDMLMSGTTLFADLYYSEDIIFEAADKLGIRALLSWVTLDRELSTQKGDPVENCENFIKEYRGRNDRIIPAAGIQGVYVASDDTIEGARDIAKKYGTQLHMHVSETRKEVYDFLDKRGKRVVEYLDDLGVLSQNFLAAHCLWLNGREISLLGKNRCTVSWNGVSNSKLGHGGHLAYEELKNAGANISFGTDSVGSNNSQNVLENAKFSSLDFKNSRWDGSMMNSLEIFRALTLNGYLAAGIKNGGLIEEGYLADLNIIDHRNSSLVPLRKNNVISSIVYSMDRDAITDVIINGEYVKKNGKLNDAQRNQFNMALKNIKESFTT